MRGELTRHGCPGQRHLGSPEGGSSQLWKNIKKGHNCVSPVGAAVARPVCASEGEHTANCVGGGGVTWRTGPNWPPGISQGAQSDLRAGVVV